MLWFNTPNPLFGEQIPKDMFVSGRSKEGLIKALIRYMLFL